jgi:parallel beta-helix repeat protein
MPKGDWLGGNRIGNRINSRTRITRPGIYTLTTDIHHGGGTLLSEACIHIESDFVILDGAGHTVDGRGVSDTAGIAITSENNVRNIIIMNIEVADWDRGFVLKNVSGGSLYDVQAINNGYGISIQRTHDFILNRNRITNNLLGLYLDPVSDVDLVNNTFESNHGRDIFDQSNCE